MPRKSEGPRYYKSKGAWFANLQGERVRLAAWSAANSILSTSHFASPAPEASAPFASPLP